MIFFDFNIAKGRYPKALQYVEKSWLEMMKVDRNLPNITDDDLDLIRTDPHGCLFLSGIQTRSHIYFDPLQLDFIFDKQCIFGHVRPDMLVPLINDGLGAREYRVEISYVKHGVVLNVEAIGSNRQEALVMMWWKEFEILEEKLIAQRR